MKRKTFDLTHLIPFGYTGQNVDWISRLSLKWDVACLLTQKQKNPPLLDYRYILCLVNFVVISIEVGAANFSKSFTFAYIYISTHFD